MSPKDFTYLLQHPHKVVSPVQTNQLEEVLEEFPYFQSARALHLRGLKNLNSFKYNNALKVTAAYTADREVLFDFITSKGFLRQNPFDKTLTKSSASGNTSNDIGQEHSDGSEGHKSETSDESGLSLTQAEAEALLDPKLFTSKDPNIDKALSETEKEASDNLEIGEPLPFTKKEKYSFGEWLQLTNFKPVKRNPKPSSEKKIKNIPFPLEDASPQQGKDSPKRKKFDLIDKFIAENPKIDPKKEVPKIVIGDSVKFDKKELMTETLAKVYLEQKKYKKAVQAYRILSLKYPEKSGFFADRIKAVERLKEDSD